MNMFSPKSYYFLKCQFKEVIVWFMDILQCSTLFDRFLQVERNLSSKTREAYQYDLHRFFSFVAGRLKVPAQDINVRDIDQEVIKLYLAHLQGDKHYKSSTLARCLVSVRVYFDFCVREKIIESSPAGYIFSPKHPKKLPIYLIESELRQLFSAPDRETVWGKRDYAILICLGLTGMRRQELVGLNIEGVDFLSKTLKVWGKGAKERLIPMNAIVEEALRDWLSVRPVIADPSSVFVNRRFGKRLTGRAIWDLVEKYLQMAGVPKENISPHKLRHTFATLLHLNSVELVEIQKLLGHASIASTQIYTHTNVDQLRMAVDSLERIVRKK